MTRAEFRGSLAAWHITVVVGLVLRLVLELIMNELSLGHGQVRVILGIRLCMGFNYRLNHHHGQYQY